MTLNQPMKIILIAALDENNLIGNQGHIPWHIPDDFRHFRETTDGHTVVMGRKTHESLNKALPNRLNIVLTRNKDFKPIPPAVPCTTLPQALRMARERREDKVFIIGGAQIYAEAQPYAHQMILSHIHGIHKGDAFFPAWDKEWKITKEIPHGQFTIKYYERPKAEPWE